MAMSKLSPLERYSNEKRTTGNLSAENGYCYEWIRLQSFKNWPTWAAGFPSQYAKAGFYYSSDQDIVECFSCNARIGNWKNDMDIMEEHRARNSACEFLLGGKNNIPIQSPSEFDLKTLLSMLTVKDSETAVIDGDHQELIPEVLNKSHIEADSHYGLKDEIRKTSTPPQQVSGREDQCADVNALPRCPSDAVMSSYSFTETFRSHPKYPHFSSLRSRLATFRTWPKDKFQQPIELAEAGFLYAGIEDCVKCFHCNIGLRNWLQGGIPLLEHIRWEPSCEFAREQRQLATCWIDDYSSESLSQDQDSQNSQAPDNAMFVRNIPVNTPVAILEVNTGNTCTSELSTEPGTSFEPLIDDNTLKEPVSVQSLTDDIPTDIFKPHPDPSTSLIPQISTDQDTSNNTLPIINSQTSLTSTSHVKQKPKPPKKSQLRMF